MLLVIVWVGCNFENEGAPPPPGLMTFPTAMHLSPAQPGERAQHLFVVNSNFDLRWNKGSIQAYDLDNIAAHIAGCNRLSCAQECDGDEGCETHCGEHFPTLDATAGIPDDLDDCDINSEGIIVVDASHTDFLKGEVLIDSFGTGIAVASDAEGGHRIFVPVRSQEYLSSTRYEPDKDKDKVLFCGGARKCAVEFQHDGNDVENGRDISFPGEPVAIVAGALSDWNPDITSDQNFVLVAHRRGEVSLFVDVGPRQDRTLALTDTSEEFGFGLTGMMFDAGTRTAYMTGVDKRLSRVGVSVEPGKTQLATLYNAGILKLHGVGNGGDTRAGLVLPGVDGGSNEALVVTRSPDALVYMGLGPELNNQRSTLVTRTVEVGAGASRLAAGTLQFEGPDGVPYERQIVVVSCFDGRQLFIIDRIAGTTLSVVPNFSGPFEIALDGPRGLLYVADFRSSVVRIVDLQAVLTVDADSGDRVACEQDRTSDAHCEPTTAAIVATLGRPRVVQELQ